MKGIRKLQWAAFAVVSMLLLGAGLTAGEFKVKTRPMNASELKGDAGFELYSLARNDSEAVDQSSDDLSREFDVEELLEDAQIPLVSRRNPYGKVTVKNRSSFYIDIYLNGYYVTVLPPRWKLKITGVLRGYYHQLYGEDATYGYYYWGPRTFYLRKNYKWTLLD